MFRGTQTGSVDSKWRLKLPALVRTQMESKYGSLDVFITSFNGREARVYPLREWEALERMLSERSGVGNDLDGQVKSNLLFLANHNGAEGSLDSQGRILIPGPLREGSGMRSEIESKNGGGLETTGEVFMQWDGKCLLVMGKAAYEDKVRAAQLTPDQMVYASNII
jgi:MraZ protein